MCEWKDIEIFANFGRIMKNVSRFSVKQLQRNVRWHTADWPQREEKVFLLLYVAFPDNIWLGFRLDGNQTMTTMTISNENICCLFLLFPFAF